LHTLLTQIIEAQSSSALQQPSPPQGSTDSVHVEPSQVPL
jgi:hypothetical protein